MTFFLNAPEAQPIKKTTPEPELATGVFAGWGAGMSKSQLETDSNFIAARRTSEAAGSLGWEAADRIGEEPIRQRATEMGIPEKDVDLFVRMMDRKPPNMPNRFLNVVRDLASEQAEENPAAWADLDVSEDAAFNKASERMQIEHQEAVAILDMLPPGQRFMAEFFGGMAGMTADVKNIPFMLMGGAPGSFMRIMGREAMINMGAEAAFLPAQFSQAERLNIPDPDIPTQLAMAAGGGAILGGAFEAGRRGITYWRGRNTVQPMQGYDQIKTTQLVDEAEDILTSDTPQPFEQIEKLAEENPPAPENPMNPERPPLLSPEPEEPPLPPENPVIREETIASFDEEIQEAKAQDHRSKKPLSQFLRDNHKSGGENLQIHPEGFAAGELRARGVTPKSMPGLFSKNGRKDFDNLVADEWDANLPGIREAAGVADDGIYLDRDGFLDTLARDLNGDSDWMRTRQEVHRLEAEKEEYLRWGEGTPEADYRAMEPSDDPDGLFFDPDHNFTPQELEAMFDEWSEQRGFMDILEPEERAEILAELQAGGGDPQYLVEQTLSRERDFVRQTDAEAEAEDIPFGDDDFADGRGPFESDPFTSEAQVGRAGQEGGTTPVAATERTDAGEQIVAPGIEPVTQRQRLEAAQNAPLRGGEAAADDGLFDLGARAQRDMFSDPAGKEAEPILDLKEQDMRADIEANGATKMPMDDGRVMTDAEVLDELDADKNFLEIITTCMGGPK